MHAAMGYHFSIAVLTSAAIGGPALAQDPPPRVPSVLELTMVLIPANAETPEAVTAKIELPKDAASGNYIPSAQSVEHSERGLETANAAREDGRAFGQATAAAARDNREDAVRASHGADEKERPAPPETPDRPTPPDR